MKNLAGDPKCDIPILKELRRARIDAVHGERCSGEVAASVTGKLGRFTFRRAWYYWVAEGPVPVEVARELHADPVGLTDIRVNGNCGCPDPSGNQVQWFSEDGRRILDLRNRDECERLAAADSGTMREIARNLRDMCEFAEDPSAVPGARGFVNLYHIDSEVGLRVFADALRRHGLVGAKEVEP